MSIEVTQISLDKFEQRQLDFSRSDFMQSAAFARTQLAMGSYVGLEAVEITDGDRLIGQSIITYRPHMKFFKKACIYQGPLMDYSDLALVKAVISAIELYVKKKAQILEFHSSIENLIYNDKLEVEEEKNKDLFDMICNLGFNRSIDRTGSGSIDQIFVKRLEQFTDAEDIYKSFYSSLRGSIKKYKDSHIRIKELSMDELPEFYDILEKTSERKSFFIQPLEYFETIKAEFGENAKFLKAYIDCEEYTKYLDDNISLFENRIAELSERGQSKKTKGLITDAKDQLGSYQKRKREFEALNITTPTVNLSSYLFICYGDEVIFLFGGSYAEYMHLGGATMLNWEMIKYAHINGYPRYNFYGTIETDQAINSTGNYNFKKSFGGNLILLGGSFTKTLSPLVKFLDKIRK